MWRQNSPFSIRYSETKTRHKIWWSSNTWNFHQCPWPLSGSLDRFFVPNMKHQNTPSSIYRPLSKILDVAIHDPRRIKLNKHVETADLRLFKNALSHYLSTRWCRVCWLMWSALNGLSSLFCECSDLIFFFHIGMMLQSKSIQTMWVWQLRATNSLTIATITIKKTCWINYRSLPIVW